MKKIFTTFQLVIAASVMTAQAQSYYKINNSYIDLDNLTKVEPAALTDSAAVAEKDFKHKGFYANRFNVINTKGTIPPIAYYQERPFKVLDDNHLAYKVTPEGRDIKIMTNSEEEVIDKIPGAHFVFAVTDGIVCVQRFEGKTGYRISKYDEWAKLKYKTNFPHTLITERDGKEFPVPYLQYLTHTDRFMMFSALNTRTVHKSVVVDLKDGKLNNIELSICGVIRAENELAFKGYVIRDETAKTLKFSVAGNQWAIRENNVINVMAEGLLQDSSLVFARYYRGTPTISLAANKIQGGKNVWLAQVKQPTTAADILYLSAYKNMIILEGVVTGENNNFMEVFDNKTGKLLYSSF